MESQEIASLQQEIAFIEKLRSYGITGVSVENKDGIIAACFRSLDWYADKFSEQNNKIQNYNLSHARFYKIEIYRYDDEDQIVSDDFYVSTADRGYSKIIGEKIKELNIDYHVSYDGEVWPKIRAIELKFEQSREVNK